MSHIETSDAEAAQDAVTPDTDSSQSAVGRNLPPAAKRALAEAEARREARSAEDDGSPTEIGGAQGPHPTRYGEWEKDGIVSDF